jgi:hypothetical protein
VRARRVPLALLLLTGLLTGTAGPLAGRAQSATITGQVMTSEADASPVRRAIVTLTGGNLVSNLSAVADDQGRFRFVDLAPGRYSLSVAKAGYLTTAYGARRPGRPGVSLTLVSGQQLDVRIALPKGAVITGTVRDEFGQPAADIRVTVSSAALVRAQGGFRSPADTLLTDDRGVYRAYGLMPDEYVVSAVPQSATGTRLASGEFDARVRGLEQRQTGNPNASAPPGAISEEPERVSFAPTFFPGTVIAANAGRVSVAAGEERSGVDIPLVPVRTARVSGAIVGHGDIEPQRIRPALVVQGPPQPGLFNPSLTGPAADGSFSFANVTPGRYTLLAATGQGAMMSSVDGRSGSTINPGVRSLFATVELDVTGADISGVTLSLRPALTISGRVVFAGSGTKPPAPQSVRVSLARSGQNPDAIAMGGRGGGGMSPPSADVSETGRFELVGVIPGEYTVAATAPSGWRLRSVMTAGRDLLDLPLALDGSLPGADDVVITFSDRRSELTGTLVTATGQPASEFTVIAFPVDRTYWRPGARRIKVARPASNGAFSILDLPAGEYLIAALTDFDPFDLALPGYLEQVLPAGVKVTIIDGEQTRQDLRISG